MVYNQLTSEQCRGWGTNPSCSQKCTSNNMAGLPYMPFVHVWFCIHRFNQLCIMRVGLLYLGFPDGSVEKNPPASVGDVGSILGSGREDTLEKEMATHSSLDNPMDWGAWWAAAHRAAMGWTRLSRHAYTHAKTEEREGLPCQSSG